MMALLSLFRGTVYIVANYSESVPVASPGAPRNSRSVRPPSVLRVALEDNPNFYLDVPPNRWQAPAIEVGKAISVSARSATRTSAGCACSFKFVPIRLTERNP